MLDITPRTNKLGNPFLILERIRISIENLLFSINVKGEVILLKIMSIKKNKYKPKGKAMATTLDDDSDMHYNNNDFL